MMTAAWLATAMAGPVMAQPAATGAPTVQELTAPARLHDASVSPSGRYVAIVRRSGDRDVIVVVDWVERKQTVLNADAELDVTSVKWIRWKTDDRLVFGFFGYRYMRESDGTLRAPPRGFEAFGGIPSGWISRTLSVNRDGSALTSLGSGSLIGDMPDDPDHVLIAGYDKDSVGRWLKAIKINVRTGKKQVLDSGTGQTRYWEADRAGRLILRFDANARTGDLSVLGREGPDSWRDLFKLRPRDARWMADLEILGSGPAPGKVYVAVKPEAAADGGDTRELRLYDFANRSMGPKIWSHGRYDFDRVVYGDDEQTVAGFCFWADHYQCDFTDEALKRDYATVGKALGADRSILFGTGSANGDVRVISASAPAEPGRIYVFDRRSGKIELLGAQWPTLKPERLGVTTRQTWKARDGLALTGYVTSPPGKPAGPLPLIVMPHGGPEARDNMDFEPWAQAFATRGYMVFQPNFRGSGGFGRGFAERGHGEWGLKMQDDVLDGVQALVDSGQVDPNRICIVGASYGGYVSLYAGARHPERFKCVVSVAGVSDLIATQKWERSVAGADSLRYQYWLKSIGDPEKDRERLAATSPITYAASYGPPVLLIHGDQDDIVPIAQSRSMDAALRKAGKSVRLIEYPGEGHNGWDSATDASVLTEMLSFVDKAIGPKPR